MNKSGFTLVEVIAVIAVLGILMGISITAVTKYIEKAKNETEVEMTETVKKATVSYIQANKDLAPKEDGSSVDIYVSELYDNKYITEKLVNGDKIDCMSDSYTRVTKIHDNKYKYSVYLNCGGKEIKNEARTIKPVIGNFKFNNLDDINNMSFSFSIFIDNEDDYIDNYSYIIYSKINSNYDYEEVYDSGPISGNHKSSISDTIKVKELISFINNNDLKVKVIVKSSSGITNTKTINAK